MGGRPYRVEDEEILRAFVDSDDPVLSTTEVADVIGFSQKGMWERLTDLHEQGHLETKHAGQTKIWWLTDSGKKYAKD